MTGCEKIWLVVNKYGRLCLAVVGCDKIWLDVAECVKIWQGVKIYGWVW